MRRNPGSAVEERDLPDETLLSRDHYGTRTSDWGASVACAAGSVAIGICGSGGDPDCYDWPKEILCSKRSDGAIVDNSASPSFASARRAT